MALDTSATSRSPSKPKRPPKPKPVNPVEASIKSWLETLPPELLHSMILSTKQLLLSLPKRWVVYPPMVLLPSGSFGEAWWSSLGSKQIMSDYRKVLWELILENITKREGKGILTHLAINSGIPLHKTLYQADTRGENINTHHTQPHPDAQLDDDDDDGENILRTPSGLVMLHGDFGPCLPPDQAPSEIDFQEAFWVSTRQNGITQTWAPRYTMFSRGNIKEKSRLLDFHNSQEYRKLSKQELAESTVVDLYAGIGYFVFSYVKAGFRRVIGWELNPWSVEALRRGSVANHWPMKIIKELETPELGDERIIIFLEDNRKACARMKAFEVEDLGIIRHVNCGLLPTSEGSWKTALEVLGQQGWIHVHENVGVNDVQVKRLEIEGAFRQRLKEADDEREVEVEHVEFVKTFAPGVWHCVFDVRIRPPVAGKRILLSKPLV